MIYYEKTLGLNESAPPIAFNRFRNLLDFREFITHEDNLEHVARWCGEHRATLPDFAASVVAQLHETGLLKGRYVREAIRYCRAVMESQGYEETALSLLVGVGNNLSFEHLILVAGCQGHAVRDSRARAAYRLVARLNEVQDSLINVVFSGKNPAEKEGEHVLTRNEAVSLRNEFRRLVDHDSKIGQERFRLHLEHESRSTLENLKKVFAKDIVQTARPTHLYLVSSTFHLSRLALNAEHLIGEDAVLADAIKKIILVGGESTPDETPVAEVTLYVKAMMFEVFLHLFENQDLGKYRGAV